MKVVDLLAGVFSIGIVLVLLCWLVCRWSLCLVVVFGVMICVEWRLGNKSLKIGLLWMVGSFIELIGYGSGLVGAWWKGCVLVGVRLWMGK